MLKKLRRNYRRLAAFMLTIAMTFTNIGTNLNVAFAAGEEQEALFLVDGEELREAIQDAVENGETFRFSSLELKAKTKSLKTSYEKLIGGKNGVVYQLDIEVDDRYAPEDTSVEIFYNAGTEEVIFLFINESDMVVKFRANVDGWETAKVAINPNAANVDDTEASYVEDYSDTVMIDDTPHTLGAEVLGTTAGTDAEEEMTADAGETTDAAGETAGGEASEPEETQKTDEAEPEETTEAGEDTGEEGTEGTTVEEAGETEAEAGETEAGKTEAEAEEAKDAEEAEATEPETEEIEEAEPEAEEAEVEIEEAEPEAEEAEPEPEAEVAEAAAPGEGSAMVGISVRRLQQVASSVRVLDDADIDIEPEDTSREEEPEAGEEIREEDVAGDTADEEGEDTDPREETETIDIEDIESGETEDQKGADSGEETENTEETTAAEETGDKAEDEAVTEPETDSQDAAKETGAGSELEESRPEESKAGETGPEQDQTEEGQPEESQAGTSSPAEEAGKNDGIKEPAAADSSAAAEPDASGRDDEDDLDGQLLEDDDIEILGELEGKGYDTVTILDSANARAWKTALEEIEAIIIQDEADYTVDYHVNDPEAAAVKGEDHVAGGEDLYFAVELEPGFEITAVYANGTELEETEDPAELASASDWRGYSHVYVVEHVEEDLWIDVETEALEKTIGAAAYTGETEDAVFTVNAPDGAFEEEVRLQVSRIEDQEHVEELKAQAKELLKDGQTIADILVYDVTFISKETGEQVEPARAVSVKARMKTPVAPGETAEDSLHITEISVVHLPDDKEAEIVASTDNAQETEFRFETESFSEFMFLAMTDTELANGVAKIVSEKEGQAITTYYATLQEAVDAVGGTGENAQPEGAEIVLLADLKENITSTNKSYTLDMDGYKLTSGEMGKSIYVLSGGTVTIKNGTIYGAYKNPDKSGKIYGIDASGAELSLVNCRVTENEQTAINASKGSLALEKCVVSNNGGAAIYASGCDVTITGGGRIQPE